VPRCGALPELPHVQKTIAPNDPQSYSFRPIIFSGSMKNETPQILGISGYALSKIAGRQILVGLIWNIRDGNTKVPLRIGNEEFSIWLQKLINARREASPPPLLLNDHCQICEFRQRCRKQAIDESNLSLLKGMTVNEIAKYNAKGLFTVNQLSYTFRSRRKPKRARAKTGPHYFSLQAQALREKRYSFMAE
jgi:predicted RecB family nuclease